MSNVILVGSGFALLRLAFGLKNSRHFVIQSEVKLKPNVTRLYTFSRAFCQLIVLASCFDWFTGLSAFAVIGQGKMVLVKPTLTNNYIFQEFCSTHWSILESRHSKGLYPFADAHRLK